MSLREDFAHAVLEARLREGFVDIKYVSPSPLSREGSVIKEALHDNSARRVVETVENIASRVIDYVEGRATVVATPLHFMSSDVELTIIEVEEHDV